MTLFAVKATTAMTVICVLQLTSVCPVMGIGRTGPEPDADNGLMRREPDAVSMAPGGEVSTLNEVDADSLNRDEAVSSVVIGGSGDLQTVNENYDEKNNARGKGGREDAEQVNGDTTTEMHANAKEDGLTMAATQTHVVNGGLLQESVKHQTCREIAENYQKAKDAGKISAADMCGGIVKAGWKKPSCCTAEPIACCVTDVCTLREAYDAVNPECWPLDSNPAPTTLTGTPDNVVFLTIGDAQMLSGILSNPENCLSQIIRDVV